MIVTGITRQLLNDAEEKCAEEFRIWLPEARNGRWRDWPELLRSYPTASRLEGNETHFPLAEDGTGIRATIVFQPGVIRLLRIAPAPLARRSSPLSRPRNPEPKHEIPSIP